MDQDDSSAGLKWANDTMKQSPKTSPLAASITELAFKAHWGGRGEWEPSAHDG